MILVESSVNLGFGKANNLASSYSTGKYLLLLNSDTILLNNAIKYFYDYVSGCIDEVVCGTWLLDNRGNIVHSSGKFLTIWSELKHDILIFPSHIPFINRFIYEQPVLEVFDENINSLEVDYITGADLFISKKVFEEVGMFDSDFFMYFEDTDLQKRLSNKNISRLLIKGPQIVHYGAGSQKMVSINSLMLPTKSFILYMKKHNSKLSYIFFRVYYFILKTLLVLFLRFTIKEKITFIKLLFYGK